MRPPIEWFHELWRSARERGSGRQRNAVCVSTIDPDGYPSARFVDLKEAGDAGFVFCTHLESAKAADIRRNPKACMTLWWEHVAMQVRITGVCTQITDQEADLHWISRGRDAQVASSTFQQSRPLSSPSLLAARFDQAQAASAGRSIPRPAHWGGFRLRADRIEFLEFHESRVHERTCYARVANGWSESFLQP